MVIKIEHKSSSSFVKPEFSVPKTTATSLSFETMSIEFHCMFQ